MTPELIRHLQFLADKYEVSDFSDSDPCQFLRWYPVEQTVDVECISFIAAMLAFGNRKQFIPKIWEIIRIIEGTDPLIDEKLNNGDRPHKSITAWITSGAPDFPHGEKKFYRFYSYDDMHNLFTNYSVLLKAYGSLGEYVRMRTVGTDPSEKLYQIISNAFPDAKIVPKGKSSANKRIHMFLRWMVRKNSPVDLGIWTWANPADLLIPLDIHVMKEGVKLGLIPENATASLKTAVALTSELEKAFPEDPARGDFALYGLGIDV